MCSPYPFLHTAPHPSRLRRATLSQERVFFAEKPPRKRTFRGGTCTIQEGY